MFVPAVIAVDTESKFKHVAFFDIVQGMLEKTIGFFTDTVFQHSATDRHALRVELMEKTTGIAFHAEALQPVRTHRLSCELIGKVTGPIEKERVT